MSEGGILTLVKICKYWLNRIIFFSHLNGSDIKSSLMSVTIKLYIRLGTDWVLTLYLYRIKLCLSAGVSF